jgi:CRP-like cAMP-binding protein
LVIGVAPGSSEARGSRKVELGLHQVVEVVREQVERDVDRELGELGVVPALVERVLPRRVVIQTFWPGSIDGDIQLLLGIPMPYETRANTASTCLLLHGADFEELLATHPQLSRRWLTSVAQRLARSHSRLTSLLGEPLEVQIAQLLLDESVDDVVGLPQITVAALLGVRRPSVNRVLRRFARSGLVEVSYGKVRMIDRAGLEAAAAA